MTQIYQELAGLWVSDSVRSLGDSADRLKSDFQATRQIQYILRIGVRVQGSHGLLQLTLFFSIRRHRSWQLNLEIEGEPNCRVRIGLAGLGSSFVEHFLLD